jgi:hypothetical protein
MECASLCSYFNLSVFKDPYRKQVSRTTVRPWCHLFLRQQTWQEIETRSSRRLADVGVALAISKPGVLPCVIVCRAAVGAGGYADSSPTRSVGQSFDPAARGVSRGSLLSCLTTGFSAQWPFHMTRKPRSAFSVDALSPMHSPRFRRTPRSGRMAGNGNNSITSCLPTIRQLTRARLPVLILAGTMLDWAKCEVGTGGKQSEAYLIRNSC